MTSMKKIDAPDMEAFTFGESHRLSTADDITQYFEAYWNGEYYEMPYSTHALGRLFTSALYLKSALSVKRNILASCYKPNKLLSQKQFNKLVLDYLWWGNAYVEAVHNRIGGIMELKASPAKFTRRIKNNRFIFLNNETGKHHQFKKDRVLQLIDPDINQEMYGMPDWMPAINSAALNTDASLFRLRYYRNGSHAGYILYLTDPSQNPKDIENIKSALKNSKGPGNFRNLFVYAPNGQKDGIQVLPVSEVAAKDEFFNIKNITRDDQLAAVRVPPSIMGIIPTNTSGLGSPDKAAKVFNRNEVKPLQDIFLQINTWLGDEVVEFDPYVIDDDDE